MLSPEWKVVTSGGSTGRPKLIVATSPADADAVGPLGILLRLRPDGATLVTGPMSHNAPFVAMIAGLLLGNHVVVMPRFDAAETLRLVERHGIDWLYLVPTMMLRIWRAARAGAAGVRPVLLRIAFHMAAPCARWLKKEWIGWLGAEKVLELYGGTELQAMTVITGTEWLDTRARSDGRCSARSSAAIRRRGAAARVGELWMRRGVSAAIPYRYVGASAKAAGELGVLGRHRLRRRGRLRLHHRSGHGHDPRRRRERVPGGDRGGARRASGGALIQRDRTAARGAGAVPHALIESGPGHRS